jgi:hypothetical protein
MYQNNFTNPKTKPCYNRYCAISRKVIRETKKLCHSTLISNPVNKLATAWSIIKQETDKIQVQAILVLCQGYVLKNIA